MGLKSSRSRPSNPRIPVDGVSPLVSGLGASEPVPFLCSVRVEVRSRRRGLCQGLDRSGLGGTRPSLPRLVVGPPSSPSPKVPTRLGPRAESMKVGKSQTPSPRTVRDRDDLGFRTTRRGDGQIIHRTDDLLPTNSRPWNRRKK